jgi:hypothetical protein
MNLPVFTVKARHRLAEQALDQFADASSVVT